MGLEFRMEFQAGTIDVVVFLYRWCLQPEVDEITKGMGVSREQKLKDFNLGAFSI